MTAVSQIIPNFVQGINEQPDELKKPGQVRDAVNCIPDVTKGLVKRPGYELLLQMSGIDGSGSWFEMYREDDNGLDFRYVVNIDSTGFTRVWNADTKSIVPVYNYNGSLKLGEFDRSLVLVGSSQTPINYLVNSTGQSPPKLREVVINDTAFIVNPHETVSMSISDETSRPYEAFIELTTFDPSRSYNFTVDIVGNSATNYNKITRIEQISNAGLGGDNNRLEGCPLVNRWRKATNNIRGNSMTITGTAVAPVEVEIEIGARPKIGGDWDNTAYCNYYIVNTRLLNGGLGWSVGDKFRISFPSDDIEGDFNGTPQPQNFSFTFEVTEVVDVSPTVDFQITAEDTSDDASILGVLGKLKIAFEARTEFSKVEIVGNGIYLESSQPFLVDTSEKDLANILCTQSDPNLTVPNPIMTANSAANLPLESKVGVVVKVENSFSDEDDYYVRFSNDYNNESTTSGQGYWKECSKPLEKDTLNPDSMPHVLFHDQPTSNISSEYFVVANVSYDKRDCGDAKTFNPSFDGKKITNIAFFRNRLIAFSEENIVSTTAGDYDNWFPSTALTTSPTDPIDIAATTNYSSILYGGITINNAMVVFSEYNQYLLTTDSDVFDARTAKVSQLASYHYDTDSDPINLGTNIGFLGGANNDSKLLEMSNIFREGQVDVNERSKVISKSFAPNYNIISSSRETGSVTFAKYNSNIMWLYKYFTEGSQKDVMNAWVKIQLPDPVVFQFTSKEQHYVVVNNNSNYFLLMADNNSDVYIDAWSETDLGYTYTNSITITNKTGDQLTGEPFEMSISLPTFFVLKTEQQAYRADTTASLVIHRMHLNTGESNYFDITVNRYAKDPYVITKEPSILTYEQSIADSYLADSQPVTIQREQTVPLYEKNENLDIAITSDFNGPFTLYSLRWEGDYNTRYYQRV